MGKFLKMIEQWLSGGPGASKRVKTFRWLMLIGLVGAALMIFNSFSFLSVKEVDPIGTGRASPQTNQTQTTFLGGGNKEKSAFSDYEHEYESQLREILQKIVGVGVVEVMVTIDSTEEVTVDKNVKDSQQVTNESDTNGATRRITDVTRSGDTVVNQNSGNQNPFVLKYTKPKIRGVVVVANGAENLTVKKLLTEAVERGLDVPSNRISILPRKQ
ncbi:MAG: stage sporulation protein [Bacilli bacterium]|nr:stage sporulation protein [Bacilli bacterium]